MTPQVRTRLFVLTAVSILAILFILPTISPQSFPKWISKPVSLGLDLKGGVHLVYEVDIPEAIKSRLQADARAARRMLVDQKIAVVRSGALPVGDQMEIVLTSARRQADAEAVIAQNFAGLTPVSSDVIEGDRLRLVYRVKPEEQQSLEARAVRQSVETLRNRVDQFGVSEPLIQQVGAKRIQLQMPGVKDVESVKRIVGRLARLEFRLVPRGGEEGLNSVRLKTIEGAEQIVGGEVLMTGDAVQDARSNFLDGKMQVTLQFNAQGRQQFARATTDNVGRQFAIILDNVVYSAPVINEPIVGGSALISGSFTPEEASQLALVLRAGALPAPLKVMEERTVGPTLGAESIKLGVISICLSLALLLVFMTFYYRLSGVVAVASLTLNVLLLVAVLSAFGATLTLPGLAGIALTIGMAVDSNIIIFERIRDELKLGAGRDAAVSAGFDKAWSAIFDANLTSLVIAIILYMVGSGPIRGFALTTGIGLLTTMFCAVFAARVAFDLFDMKGRKEPLSI